MKYIIMCGGNYKEFETPKQMLKVYGEMLVERTIRLLRENGVNDIYISSNNPVFDCFSVPRLQHENDYNCEGKEENRKSKRCWLNAYYPTDEPVCYLHGDVYFSEQAIKTIVETPVENTMFFCTYDWSDGEKDKRNYKGREPFAYKVQNQKVFRYAINKIFDMVDNGYFKDGLPPICWHLYRFLNGYDVKSKAKQWTEVNDIFKSKGDYIVINDYTTDIDHPEDVKVLEEYLKR